MVFRRIAVGIDIGAHAVKVVQVRIVGSEANVDRSIVLDRSLLEAEEAVVTEPERFSAFLCQKMQEARIQTKDVVLALDAKDSMIRYTHVPPMAEKRLEMVMGYEIQAVADRMEELLASDYAILPIRRETDGERSVLLGFAKDEPLRNLLDTLERAGITVAFVVPGPLALFGAWDLYGTKDEPDAPENDLVLGMDLGASTLHTVLVLNNRLAFARSAMFGGDQFTEALASGMGVGDEEAERIKVTRGGVDDARSGVGLETIGPLRGMAGQLLGMVQSSVKFCKSQAGTALPEVSRLWVTGGGMCLRGLPQYLGSALGGVPVESFHPQGPEASRADEPHAAESTPSLALALGLSALGLQAAGDKSTAVAMNVLPGDFKARRFFRDRTVYLYAAGVLLLLFLAIQFAQGVVKSSHANGREEDLRTALGQLQEQLRERDQSSAQSSEIRARINRLLRDAEPTAFQGFVLTVLGESLRPEVQIRLVTLEADARDDGAGYDYVLLIEGRANNEKRKGLDSILVLQETLIKEERVGNVRILSSRPEGHWYTFKFAVEPSTPLS